MFVKFCIWWTFVTFLLRDVIKIEIKDKEHPLFIVSLLFLILHVIFVLCAVISFVPRFLNFFNF